MKTHVLTSLINIGWNIKRLQYLNKHSRFLEDPTDRATDKQAELLGEEHPGDLLQRGLRLTPKVQDRGT